MKNPGLEDRARTNGTSRSEDCALSTQPNPQLQNRWFMPVNFRRKPFQSTQKTTEDVDDGHSKECRSFDVYLHCNTFKIRFWTVYTQAYGGRGAIAPEHAAAKRGHHRFFFWSKKKGGSSAPSEPPLATCLARLFSVFRTPFSSHVILPYCLLKPWHTSVLASLSLAYFRSAS